MEDFEFDLSKRVLELTEFQQCQQAPVFANVQSLLSDVEVLNDEKRFDQSLDALREAASLSHSVSELTAEAADSLSTDRDSRLTRLAALLNQLELASEPEEAEKILSDSEVELAGDADDATCIALFSEIKNQVLVCRSAVESLAQDKPQDCIDHCDSVLRNKPHHVLFLGLRVQAKAADYSSQMAAIARIRALLDCGPLAAAQAAIKTAAARFPDAAEIWELDFDVREKAIRVRNLVERGEEQLKDQNFDGAGNCFAEAVQLLPFDTVLRTSIVSIIHLYARTIAPIDGQAAEAALRLVDRIEPGAQTPDDIGDAIHAARFARAEACDSSTQAQDSHVTPPRDSALTPEVLVKSLVQSPLEPTVTLAPPDPDVIDIGRPQSSRSLKQMVALLVAAAALFAIIRAVPASNRPQHVFEIPDLTPGTLTVHSNVRDAVILVSGRKYSLPPNSLAASIGLAPDTYQISGFHDGYSAFGPVTVELKPGGDAMLNLQLKPNPAALELSHAQAGINVTVDGKLIGTVGKSGTLVSEVTPGRHSVLLSMPGYTPKTLVRTFNPGEASTLTGSDIALDSTDASTVSAKPSSKPEKTASAAPILKDLVSTLPANLRASLPPLDTPQLAWQKTDKRDVTALQSYVTIYPDSPFATQAKEQIQAIVENNDWNLVDRTDKAAAVAFLNKHRNGPHAAVAMSLITDLDRRAQEDNAWLAVHKDNRQALESYISLYPSSRHRDEAQRALANLAANEASRADSAAILDVLRRLASAWNTRDLKAITAIQHNLDPRNLKLQLTAVKSLSMRIAPVMAPQIDGNQATVICKRQAYETFADGTARQNPESIVTYVLSKRDGLWAIEQAR